MRKIYLLFVSVIFLFSCNNDDLDFDGFAVEEQAVSFYVPENGQYAVTEGNNTHYVGVVRNVVSDSPITVSYTIEELGATSQDYAILSEAGQVVIPANQASGFILFETFDNMTPQEPDKIVRLTITDVSDGAIIDDSRGRVSVADIVIKDDDCPFFAACFEGVYSVSEVFTSGTNEGLTLAGAFGESYQVEIKTVDGDATDTMLEFSNSSGFNVYIPDGLVATLDAATGTVSFDNPSPVIAEFALMNIQSAVFDNIGLTITANGPLGNFGPYQFILTKQ